MAAETHIVVKDLTMAYGDNVIQHDLSFEVMRGDVFVIMGGSGCGKSSLLRHMIGIHRPAKGKVFYDGLSYWDAEEDQQRDLMRNIGVLYQAGALWSSMTLAENVAIPLQEYTDLDASSINELVSLKLSLVGLGSG